MVREKHPNVHYYHCYIFSGRGVKQQSCLLTSVLIAAISTGNVRALFRGDAVFMGQGQSIFTLISRNWGNCEKKKTHCLQVEFDDLKFLRCHEISSKILQNLNESCRILLILAESWWILQNFNESCRILQNPDKSWWIVQNPAENRKILKNTVEYCRIVQNIA